MEAKEIYYLVEGGGLNNRLQCLRFVPQPHKAKERYMAKPEIKVKFFTGISRDILEDEINEWLASNVDHWEVLFIQQSEEKGCINVSVWYKTEVV